MTVTEVFADSPVTTVPAGASGTLSSGQADTWSVFSSAGFPTAATGISQFHIADPAAPSEVILVTNMTGGGNTTWSVIRGADSTTPVAHAAGFTVTNVISAGWLNSVAAGVPFPITVGDGGTGGSQVTAYSLLAGGTAASTPFQSVTAGAGSIGWVLTTNGTGQLPSWQVPTGGSGLSNPMSGVGDTIYGGAGGLATRLAGGTVAVKQFLTQTGTGSASAAPVWGTIATADVPVLNQNTSGTAAAVSGTVAIANGGTGQGTRQAALNALAGGTTGGYYLRGTGSNVVLNALQAADLTGTVAVTNGGTGDNTATPYALVTGGTASTTPFQQVASLGTAGLALTSNGAGALPTWQQTFTGRMEPLSTPVTHSASPYAAAAGQYVPCDTTSGNITVNLPASQPDMTIIGIKHVIQGSTNSVTWVATGGATVNKTGGGTQGTLPLASQGVIVQYAAAGTIWYVYGDDLPLSQLDTRYVLDSSLPLAVGSGGSGGTAVTAYAIVTGGTSATTPLQHVASVGTSGQVLTSQGAGSLPTWTTAGAPAVSSITTSGTNTYTLAAATYGAFNVTLGASSVPTFDFTGLSAGSDVQFTVVFTQPVLGGVTVAWGTAITWIGGTTPELNTSTNAISVFVFQSVDGAIWLGSMVTGPTFNGAATSPVSISADAGESVVSYATIPANLAAGATYRITAWGTIATLTTSGTSIMKTRLGGLAGTQVQTLTSASLTSSNTYNWRSVAEVTLQAAAGTVGTWCGDLQAVQNIQGAAASTYLASSGTVTADSTTAQVFAVTLNLSGTASTASCMGSTWERVA